MPRLVSYTSVIPSPSAPYLPSQPLSCFVCVPVICFAARKHEKGGSQGPPHLPTVVAGWLPEGLPGSLLARVVGSLIRCYEGHEDR